MIIQVIIVRAVPMPMVMDIPSIYVAHGSDPTNIPTAPNIVWAKFRSADAEPVSPLS